MQESLPNGAILAGGASVRMRGGKQQIAGHKALAKLAGRPLIAHVIDRLRPQVAELWLSVDSPRADLTRWNLAQIADPRPGRHGPLGGLLAVLQALPEEAPWLLLAPCDAPFLPRDLGSRLMAEAGRSASPGAVAACGGEPQPTFSLWNRSLLPRLEPAVLAEGLGGFKAFLDRHPMPVVEWPQDDADAFLNVNTPEDLEHAESLVARSRAGM